MTIEPTCANPYIRALAARVLPLCRCAKNHNLKIFWDISRLVPRLQNNKSWDIIKAIWDITRLFSGTLLDILLSQVKLGVKLSHLSHWPRVLLKRQHYFCDLCTVEINRNTYRFGIWQRRFSLRIQKKNTEIAILPIKKYRNLIYRKALRRCCRHGCCLGNRPVVIG